jgi:hypothetical protein
LKQNFAPGTRLVPQVRQAICSAEPQLMQNFASAGFCVLQLGHSTQRAPYDDNRLLSYG